MKPEELPDEPELPELPELVEPPELPEEELPPLELPPLEVAPLELPPLELPPPELAPLELADASGPLMLDSVLAWPPQWVSVSRAPTTRTTCSFMGDLDEISGGSDSKRPQIGEKRVVVGRARAEAEGMP